MIKPRRLRWAGHVARMDDGRRAFKILTGNPTGKGPLGRPRRRWEDNIRLHLKEMGINTRDWGLFGSGLGLLEISCESISHRVSLLNSISSNLYRYK